VVELAQQWGCSAQIALAWLHQLDGSITGASKMNHLEDAPSALEIELTEEECQGTINRGLNPLLIEDY